MCDTIRPLKSTVPKRRMNTPSQYYWIKVNDCITMFSVLYLEIFGKIILGR